MLKTFITLLFSFFIFLRSYAQTQEFKGVVKNINQLPIPNASVKLLKNDSRGNIVYFAISNFKGEFVILFDSIKQSLWLQVSAVGYVSYDKLFDNTEGNLQIILRPFIGNLPEVNVKSDAAITKRGDTTTYKVAAFEKGNENNIADLLSKLPGIQVNENGKISFNGKSITRVLLENDDLTGSNYSGLVSNTSTNGLDKIDVIENYSDKSLIENSFSKGNEIVLNLRYKQKKIRLFSNVIVGGGLPKNTYEIKLNSIGIYKKSKLIAFANKNTIGNLAKNLNGGTNENSSMVNENEKMPFALSGYYTPFNFSDATPLNISAFRVFQNNSNLNAFNYLLKPSPKFFIKAGVNIVNDNYGQQNQLEQTFFQLPTNTQINQINFIAKNNKKLNVINEINWKPNTKLQILLTTSYNSIINNQSNSTLFNSVNQQQFINQDLSERIINFTTTKIINTKSFFKFQFVQNTRQQFSNFNFSNPTIISSFGLMSNYNNVLQKYNLAANNNMFQLSWYKKVNSTNFDIKLSKNTLHYNFNNGAYAYNLKDSFAKFNNDYFNNENVALNQKELSIGISNARNDKFSKSFGLSFQSCNLEGNYSKYFILPQTNIQYKFNNRQNLNFNIATMPILPLVNQLNRAYVFTNNFNLSKSTNESNFNTQYTASLSFSNFNIQRKGYFLFVFYMLSSSPVNYVNNALQQNNLFFNNLEISQLYNPSQSLNFSITKSLNKINSTIIQNISIGSFTSNTLIASQISKNKSFIFNTETRFRTNWKKWFNINTALIYKVQNQLSVLNDKNLANNTGADFLSNTLISIEFKKKLFIDFQNDILLNKSFDNQIRNIIFFDVKLRYVASKKITLDLLARNIFNKNSFVYNETSILNSSINTFQINPRLGILSFNYKF